MPPDTTQEILIFLAASRRSDEEWALLPMYEGHLWDGGEKGKGNLYWRSGGECRKNGRWISVLEYEAALQKHQLIQAMPEGLREAEKLDTDTVAHHYGSSDKHGDSSLHFTKAGIDTYIYGPKARARGLDPEYFKDEMFDYTTDNNPFKWGNWERGNELSVEMEKLLPEAGFQGTLYRGIKADLKTAKRFMNIGYLHHQYGISSWSSALEVSSKYGENDPDKPYRIVFVERGTKRKNAVSVKALSARQRQNECECLYPDSQWFEVIGLELIRLNNDPYLTIFVEVVESHIQPYTGANTKSRRSLTKLALEQYNTFSGVNMPSKPKKPVGPFSKEAVAILDEWLLTHEYVAKNPKTYFSREELLNKIDYWLDNYPGITKERIFSNLNPGCVRNPDW